MEHEALCAALLVTGCAADDVPAASTQAQHFMGTVDGNESIVVGLVVHDGALRFHALDDQLDDPLFAWVSVYELDGAFGSAQNGRWLLAGAIAAGSASGELVDTVDSTTLAWSAQRIEPLRTPGFLMPGVYSDEAPCPTTLLVLAATEEDDGPSQRVQGSYCTDGMAGVSREQVLIVREGDAADEVWVSGEHTVDVLVRRKTRLE